MTEFQSKFEYTDLRSVATSTLDLGHDLTDGRMVNKDMSQQADRVFAKQLLTQGKPHQYRMDKFGVVPEEWRGFLELNGNRYDEESAFCEVIRAEAFRPAETGGRTRREIADNLGIGLSLLTRWLSRNRDAIMDDLGRRVGETRISLTPALQSSER